MAKCQKILKAQEKLVNGQVFVAHVGFMYCFYIALKHDKQEIIRCGRLAMTGGGDNLKVKNDNGITTFSLDYKLNFCFLLYCTRIT